MKNVLINIAIAGSVVASSLSLFISAQLQQQIDAVAKQSQVDDSAIIAQHEFVTKQTGEALTEVVGQLVQARNAHNTTVDNVGKALNTLYLEIQTLKGLDVNGQPLTEVEK